MDKKDKTYFNILRKVDFFNEMSNNELRDIASVPKHFKKFKAGEYIIMEGGNDRSLYIILNGRAVVSKRINPDVHLAILEKGSPFGEMSLVSKRQRTTDVKAYQGETLVLEIGQSFFKENNPEIPSKVKDKVINILVNRLDEMNNRISKIG